MLRLRYEGNGARRIQTELRLFEQTEFSLATIHGILCGMRTASTDGCVHQVSPDSAAFTAFERQGRTIATDRFGGILVATFAEGAIQQRIEEWQFIYNYRRSHGQLGGKTPAAKIGAVGERAPLSEPVVAAYDEARERIRYSDWKKDQAMTALYESRSH